MFNLLYFLFVSFFVFCFVLLFFHVFLVSIATVRVLFMCTFLFDICSTFCVRLQSPPASAKVPKSVSDRKRFFENAMEDHNKPAPKSGELKIQHSLFFLILSRIKPFNFASLLIKKRNKSNEFKLKKLTPTKKNLQMICKTTQKDRYSSNYYEIEQNDNNGRNTRLMKTKAIILC